MMNFLNKKVNDCVQHIILQKFTNLHAIRSWNLQNICNEIGWPRFFAPHCMFDILVSNCCLCQLTTTTTTTAAAAAAANTGDGGGDL